MEKIEASGRTVEEAVQMAAHELGVSIEAVAYETLEEGGKGFLGLGHSPCRVLAWVREDYEAPATPAPTPVVAEEDTEEKGTEFEVAASEEEEAEGMPADTGDFTGNLIRILSDVIDAMNLNAKPVLKSESEEEVEIDIVGKDLGILIGKQGRTLDALQYLVSIAANKDLHDKRRVILDAEGYRKRHQQSLEQVAKDLAAQVKEHNQEAVLEPQSARDRRIIHCALADDPDVYTYSEGVGDDRHVVISPKK